MTSRDRRLLASTILGLQAIALAIGSALEEIPELLAASGLSMAASVAIFISARRV